jgi:biotin operon repressor
MDRLILQALMTGPRTRQALVELTGKDDRHNRESIERLRNTGIAVVSSSRGAGYRLADTEAEVRAFVADMQSRAQKAFKTARRVKRAYGLRNQAVMEAL